MDPIVLLSVSCNGAAAKQTTMQLKKTKKGQLINYL
jgi:hypothetical protein